MPSPVTTYRVVWYVLWLVCGLSVGGCATDRFSQRPPAWANRLLPAAPAVERRPNLDGPAQTEDVSAESRKPSDPAFYRPGNDVVVRGPTAVADAKVHSDGNIKLNFLNASLPEVAKVILGDMLSVNYIVDPAVTGTVTMQTVHGLHREDLLPTLELLLRMNNAALIADNEPYRVVPLPQALAEIRAPQIGDSQLALPHGYNVRIVPLRHVAAEEMAEILNPFTTGNNRILRIDKARNLLILAGTGDEMERLLDIIDTFDIDRMAGMSVALFTPDFVNAATLASDLEKVLADPENGLMAGMVRFIVIERLNGLLVVTPRRELLSHVRDWVKRLDRDSGDASPRLFVYRVQNTKAADLAKTLNELFNAAPGKDATKPQLAPGLQPATIGQAPIPMGQPADTDPAAQGATASGSVRTPLPRPSATEDDTARPGFAINRGRNIQVIADEPNNALLILAHGTEYRQILTVLKQLDVSPMQVLIEVTIAEVTLTDNLSYGVEWFFKNALGSRTGIGTLDLDATVGINAIQPGFSYAIQGPGNVVQGVLNILASESNLSIISSPSLLVLNNQSASIQVGDEVPVATQQQQSTTANSNIVNSIDYRKTGLVLTVKPRVNAGGLVTMEVEQEASIVPTTSDANSLTPRIRQRKITSTVAVNSGNTIILGGLIQDNRDRAESGIPGFHKIPVLGGLFGTKADNQNRTELIVLITPRAVSNGTSALQVTEEFRQRLRKLVPAGDAKN